MSSSLLFAEPYEPVRELGAAATSVSKLSDEEAERFGVARDPQKPCIHRLEAPSRMSVAATFFPRASSPQYTRLGRGALLRASKTPTSTSLGIVLKAQTTCAPRAFFASSSAPEEVRPTTRPVLPSFIGKEQVTTTLPERSPAWLSTSSNRDQCTANKIASASCVASLGVPARALAPASRASACSFLSLRE